MKRMIVVVLVTACLIVPAAALAKKTTYIVTNKRLNYVKLVEVKSAVAEERGFDHPRDIPVEQMRTILSSIKLSKAHLIGDKVDTREVFNEQAVNYLAPALSRAFREAQSNEEVQFSYVVKNPIVILRNDRLTMVDAWVSGDEIFFQFKKLYAKLTGDTDKRGNYSQIISRAKGLRVSLELGEGQQMAAVGSRVLKVDLNRNYYAAIPSTTSQPTEEAAAEEKPRISKSQKKSKYGRKATTAETGEAVSTTTATSSSKSAPIASSSTSVAAEDDMTRRLEKLDTLRKRNLISSKEYKAKKAEILKDL